MRTEFPTNECELCCNWAQPGATRCAYHAHPVTTQPVREVKDKHTYIGGNPLMNRERIKNALIEAILAALKAEGIKSIDAARKRMRCCSRQASYIYKRQHNNVGLQKLIDCCDELGICLTLNAVLGTSQKEQDHAVQL